MSCSTHQPDQGQSSHRDPASPAPALETNARQDAEILCVESNDQTRDNLKRQLMAQGFSVHCAASGIEALEYLQCHQPKLVITDLFNEEVNGWDLLVHETLQHPELLVVVISSLPRSATRGAEYLAHAFFEKPLNVRKLSACIREKLGKTNFIHFPISHLHGHPIA